MVSRMVGLHAFVEGRVQGVGFRQWVCSHAARLELTGWVQNTEDGRVEVYAEGLPEAIDELLGLLPKGPPLAQVASIVKNLSHLTESKFEGFEFRR